jgi:hypothetical protein
MTMILTCFGFKIKNVDSKLLKKRVDGLEEALMEFAHNTERAIQSLPEEVDRLSREMRKFKDEMLTFRRNQEEEWSSIARKMETIVEDLIIPSLRLFLERHFRCHITAEGQRWLRRRVGESYEADALARCEDKVFLLEKSKSFFDFFPGYEGRELLLILGSISFPESVIKYASERGVYVMAWREWEYTDIPNFEEVRR